MSPRTERSRHLAKQAGAMVAVALAVLTVGTVATRLNAGTAQGGDPRPEPPKVKLGLAINDPRAFSGYTLLVPMKSQKTYLIDMHGRAVRTWESDSHPALSAYLLENGHLLRPAELRDQPFGGGPGAGGRIQEFTWDGTLVWDYKYANEKQLPHHDVTKLPNGNVILIVWDKKTSQEAIAAGRAPERTGDRPLQLDALIEVKPTGKTTGDVIWEWHVWDHLIQDHDSSKPNYGKVEAHPELVDINYDDSAMASLVTTKAGLDKLKSIGYLGRFSDFEGAAADGTRLDSYQQRRLQPRPRPAHRERARVQRVLDHRPQHDDRRGRRPQGRPLRKGWRPSLPLG